MQHKNAFHAKEIIFPVNVNIIHSDKNSTGKTTLLRAILYTLGFSVPNMELIRFEDYDFILDISRRNNQFSVKRKGNLLIISGQEFDLPVDQRAAHSFLFGINNGEILSNLLGTIYFDQEKG